MSLSPFETVHDVEPSASVTRDDPGAEKPSRLARGYAWVKSLKRQTGKHIPDLLALSAVNDPFYTGSPADLVKARWFEELWRRFGFTQGVHLRRIHYRLVSGEVPFQKPDGTPYENTEECWAYLGLAGKYARHLQLVPVDAFEDHRNPHPQIFFDRVGTVLLKSSWMSFAIGGCPGL